MRYVKFFALWLLPWVAASGTLQAQVPTDLFRIEEDWELVVGEPDVQLDAPQISTSMSPFSHLNDVHFSFDLNHASYPSFVPGGFQIRHLNGESIVGQRLSDTRGRLQQEGESVKWTQVLTIMNSRLLFGIINGQSQSLGPFGGDNAVIDSGPTNLTHLNTYNPITSKEWSGIGYAANRVNSMKLMRVRLYSNNGDVTTVPLNFKIE